MGGRWPSNFCIVHSPECTKAGVKRVKTKSGSSGIAKRETRGYEGGWGDRLAYTFNDPDGLETIDDWRCVEGCVVRRLGEQSGQREVSGSAKTGKPAEAMPAFGYGCATPKKQGTLHNDKGTAARFFFQADWSYERIEEEELWQRGK